MQIERKYKIEKCVSTDESRPNLQNIYVSRRHAMATNGRILAICPISVQEDDEIGWLSPDALKHARKVSPKGLDSIQIVLNGAQVLPDGTIMNRPEGENPPHTFRILKDAHSNRKYRIGVNADYLKDLSDALGNEELILEIGDPNSAILVRPVHSESGTLGLLMPIRLNNKERN
jgi:DNA polymerase III sliding clamp (beta) subunit (PCNA family)